MNSVIHFEIPYEDQNRAAEFYQKAFEWEPKHLGPIMGNYVTVKTSETEANGIPTKPGRINGGLYAKTPKAAHPSVVIGVEDIHAAMKNVQAAGGTLIEGKVPGVPDEIPGVGLFVAFIDTEGNHLSMLQPNPM